jgi:hypothetical protein
MPTPLNEMEGNAESLADHVAKVLPPDLGVIVILFNRQTGQCVLRAPNLSRMALDEILRSMAAGKGSQIITSLPPGLKV